MILRWMSGHEHIQGQSRMEEKNGPSLLMITETFRNSKNELCGIVRRPLEWSKDWSLFPAAWGLIVSVACSAFSKGWSSKGWRMLGVVKSLPTARELCLLGMVHHHGSKIQLWLFVANYIHHLTWFKRHPLGKLYWLWTWHFLLSIGYSGLVTLVYLYHCKSQEI